MNARKLSIIGMVGLFLILAVSGVCSAQEVDVEASSGDWFEEKIDGFGGEVVSTLAWWAIGLVLILLAVGLVDIVTDKMKHNWLNLEELAHQPIAMAIIAAGLMVAIAIIIHGALV